MVTIETNSSVYTDWPSQKREDMKNDKEELMTIVMLRKNEKLLDSSFSWG